MNTEYCVIGWRLDENDDCPLDEDCFYYSFINEVCRWPQYETNTTRATEKDLYSVI